jgi:ATP-dependent DNA ligase
MRLSRRAEPFDSDQLIYELKIDGFRALADLEARKGKLVSRNGTSSAASIRLPNISRRGFQEQNEGRQEPTPTRENQ